MISTNGGNMDKTIYHAHAVYRGAYEDISLCDDIFIMNSPIETSDDYDILKRIIMSRKNLVVDVDLIIITSLSRL